MQIGVGQIKTTSPMDAAIDIPDTKILPDSAALTASVGSSAGLAAGTAAAVPAPDSAKPSRRRVILIAAAVLVACAAIGGYYWAFVDPYESTDDAFVEADVTPIAPQVAGRVLRVPVSDNQDVSQGAVLFEIDPSDFQARLDQARSELAAARGKESQAAAQISVDRAKVEQERASVAAADAEAKRAEADSRRFERCFDQWGAFFVQLF